METDEMFEGYVEESDDFERMYMESEKRYEEEYSKGEYCHEQSFKWGFQEGYDYAHDNEKLEINLKNGYEFRDDNGNVINTQKIIMEKKKIEYPKTYEECFKYLGIEELELVYNFDYRTVRISNELWKQLNVINTLNKLIVARNIYWKLYGEEIGLGKPWEPDWNDTSIKYCIERDFDVIIKNVSNHKGYTFAFPTEEMRDAFFNAFREDIEKCKELL